MTRHQNSPFMMFELHLAELNIRLLFPFKYPTNADALILGGISSNI